METSLFNTNVGDYFIMCVAIYSNFVVDCNVDDFYNLL